MLDLDDDAGRRRPPRLVATADFVFENAGPGVMDARGLGFEALRDVRPDLVYVAISPFGQTGPYADHLATDLTLPAMGGAMALNGEPDRRPVRITVPQTWHHAAAESALGAMVAHERRLADRRGPVRRRLRAGGGVLDRPERDDRPRHPGPGHRAQRHRAAAEHARRRRSSTRAPTARSCLIATTATLVGLMPWMVETGAVTPEWADAEDWTTYEARMLTADALVHPLAEVREAITAFTMRHTEAGAVRGRHRPRHHARPGEHRRRRAGAGAPGGPRLLGRAAACRAVARCARRARSSRPSARRWRGPARRPPSASTPPRCSAELRAGRAVAARRSRRHGRRRAGACRWRA